MSTSPDELFRSHFADINSSIAARLDKALDEFLGASLIPSQLFDDITTTNGPAGQKASKMTRELMRGISNCKNGEERLEVICKILLKLEDEKLKEIVADIRSRIGTGSTGASGGGGGVSHPKTKAQAVDITKLRKAIENVINTWYGSLNRLPAASVKDFAYSLFSKKVISDSVCSDPTIDKILGEFKASLGFTRTVQEFESSCTKLLESMSSVGGSYHVAGAALKDDLIDAVQKDCNYSFNISM
ncbi:PREDICTED: uncharacterized protein LOC109586709 [Amphimedon queenslandica]|uniref:Uncharacterized protein n=1 Tax=Amphimedon queenslandica TaxID=400682 RepID=A0AAN0JNW1_AMPQE|nr:PREDICTED: uncharacterized protein LOC109586709 [Amphimedon queenslandica]|eukprot:XP_019858473.1 PREDICTED: uncharacterized protein LOC109586709 [Amphimedon queenslandica]